MKVNHGLEMQRTTWQKHTLILMECEAADVPGQAGREWRRPGELGQEVD